MFRKSVFPLLLLFVAAACSDNASLPTATSDEAAIEASRVAGQDAQAGRHALARRFARALADSSFRAHVKGELDASIHPEGKIHVGRFLRAAGGRGGRALEAAEGGTPLTAVEARDGERLEVYFPVPEHRASWSGGTDVIVGTIGADTDTPVAYDLRGKRLRLNAAGPPATPVLAVVPLETDFDRFERGRMSGAVAAPCSDCDGGGGGTGGTVRTPGLYMAASQLHDTFESWLKGKPEIEILVLGQKGSSDSLTKYQCAGGAVGDEYYFDQNDKKWAGSVLLMSQLQLNAYNAQHPNQALRLFFMEDDDTPCEIRTNNATLRQLLTTVDSLVKGFSGGKDVPGGTVGKVYTYFPMAQKIYSVVASFIKSNDDLIGSAVEDITTTERYAGYNWIVKGENGRTNGYVKLEMR